MAYNTKEKQALYDKQYREKNKQKMKERDQKYYLANKETIKLRSKEYYLRTKASYRTTHLKRQYQITDRDWEILYIEQQGCCTICGVHQDLLYRKLDTDHCHLSGKVRGLLCYKCNKAIGLFNDDITLLEKAKVYLTHFK